MGAERNVALRRPQRLRTLHRRLAVPDRPAVSSVWLLPQGYEGATGCALVLAHGAGSDMQHPFLSQVHRRLARSGLMTVKFNFPYAEQGRRAPDRAPVLEATWRAALDAVRGDARHAPRRLVLGGKSMGGRIASQVVAAGAACDALVFLGYPLHPAKRPEHRRTEHLRDIRVPMLFVQGTRDPLCNLTLLRPLLAALDAPVTLQVIEGADHGFAVPRSMGRSAESVLEEIVATVAAWIATHFTECLAHQPGNLKE